MLFIIRLSRKSDQSGYLEVKVKPNLKSRSVTNNARENFGGENAESEKANHQRDNDRGRFDPMAKPDQRPAG